MGYLVVLNFPGECIDHIPLIYSINVFLRRFLGEKNLNRFGARMEGNGPYMGK